jgi:hypothetical protein
MKKNQIHPVDTLRAAYAPRANAPVVTATSVIVWLNRVADWSRVNGGPTIAELADM